MKTKKKFNGLGEEYKKSFSYLKESKNYINFIVFVFFVFTLIGFFIPTPEIISNKISEFISELIGKIKDMNQSELTSFIFLNNLKSSLIGIVFGVFLGIFPILIAVANGYLLGVVALMSVKIEGIFILWKILPHGIFELPAVFISLGLGLKLGTFIFQKNIWSSFKIYFLNSLRVFLFIVIPLLVIAAIIEGFLIFVVG